MYADRTGWDTDRESWARADRDGSPAIPDAPLRDPGRMDPPLPTLPRNVAPAALALPALPVHLLIVTAPAAAVNNDTLSVTVALTNTATYVDYVGTSITVEVLDPSNAVLRTSTSTISRAMAPSSGRATFPSHRWPGIR